MFSRIGGICAGVIALISGITVFWIAVGNTRDRSALEPGASTRPVCASADRKLAERVRDIDRASVGETGAAGFLASEFGMSKQAILAEKQGSGGSWGNLVLAHTLAGSDRQGMTAAQVLLLHTRGMGWGQIAAALHFKLDDVVRAVNVEGSVARGRVKADGRTAPIGRRRAT